MLRHTAALCRTACSMASSRPRRQRKQVQAFTVPETKSVEFEVLPGEGATLSDSDAIVTAVRKEPAKSVVLTTMYRLMFKRAPKARLMRTHILAFSGVPRPHEDVVVQRLTEKLGSKQMSLIKKMMDVFGINRSALSFPDNKATKDNLVGRFVEWMLKPTLPAAKSTTSRKPATKRKRKPASSSGSASAGKTKTKKKKRVTAAAAPDVAALPTGVAEEVAKVVADADFANLTVSDVYASVDHLFDGDLTKANKRAIKQLVLKAAQA